MTNTFPFTPNGIQQAQNWLYALNDEQLMNQSIAIAQDSVIWIKDNFVLDNAQVEYLDNLPADMKLSMGWQLASGTIGRLPITMDPPIPSAKKNTHVTTHFEGTYDFNSGVADFSGEVGISFNLP